MATHNQIQFLRTRTVYESKSEAISVVKNKIEANISDFKDGEQIFISYKNDYNEICNSTLLVRISNGLVSLYPLTNDYDGLQIVEEEPSENDRKHKIWLTDADEDDSDDDITSIVELRNEISSLKDRIEFFENKFNQIPFLGGGNLRQHSYLNGDISLLVKEARTYNELVNNQTLLKPNELVWCVAEESLYIFANSKSGSVKLFKIGSINYTGDTPSSEDYITFEIVDDNILKINGTSNNISVENNTLSIIGYVENGTLILGDENSDNKNNYIVESNTLAFNNAVVQNGSLIISNGSVSDNTIIL